MSNTPERKFLHVLQKLRDLCAEAREGRLAPVFGRDAEVEAVLDGLQAGATMILGPSGIGKSAIWEEVARRVVLDLVPEALEGLTLLVTSVTLVDGQPKLCHESLRESEVGVSCRLPESESARAEDVPLVTATH